MNIEADALEGILKNNPGISVERQFTGVVYVSEDIGYDCKRSMRIGRPIPLGPDVSRPAISIHTKTLPENPLYKKPVPPKLNVSADIIVNPTDHGVVVIAASDDAYFKTPKNVTDVLDTTHIGLSMLDYQHRVTEYRRGFNRIGDEMVGRGLLRSSTARYADYARRLLKKPIQEIQFVDKASRPYVPTVTLPDEVQIATVLKEKYIGRLKDDVTRNNPSDLPRLLEQIKDIEDVMTGLLGGFQHSGEDIADIMIKAITRSSSLTYDERLKRYFLGYQKVLEEVVQTIVPNELVADHAIQTMRLYSDALQKLKEK